MDLRPYNVDDDCPDCDDCHGVLVRWLSTYPNGPQDRCPACFRACSQDAAILFARMNLEIMYRPLCLCRCKCDDADVSEDENFGADDMDVDEDDLTTQLDERTEQMFTSRYGILTNAVLNQDTDEERRIYIEGAGHYAVATSHDIGRPAESSLANTENAITRAEVNALEDPIEPWEAEALLHGTGRPYDELEDLFPELADMPSPPQPEETPEPNLVCRLCDKPVTDEFMQWLRTGTVIFCHTCGCARRPTNPEEDPDWHDFRVGNYIRVADALEHCRCRCGCYRPNGRNPDVEERYAEESQMVFGHEDDEVHHHDGGNYGVYGDDDDDGDDVDDGGDDSDCGDDDAAAGSATNHAPTVPRYVERVARPQLPHIRNINIPERDGRSIDEAFDEFYGILKQMFGLPDDLQFVDEPDTPSCRTGYGFALRTYQYAQTSIQGQAWDEAYRVLQAGYQVARHHGDLDIYHPRLIDIYRDLQDVHEHLIYRRNTSQDTMAPGDLDHVLSRYEEQMEEDEDEDDEEEEEE